MLLSFSQHLCGGVQRAAKTVVKLRRGQPALLSEPGPNPANENSAVAVDFQARHRDLGTKCPHPPAPQLESAVDMLRLLMSIQFLTSSGTLSLLTSCS